MPNFAIALFRDSGQNVATLQTTRFRPRAAGPIHLWWGIQRIEERRKS